MQGRKTKKIGLIEAVSIGIGGMVGGGIFAVLGLAVLLARGGTPLAFLLAGLIALFTSYSYAKLSLAFPDRGGTVRFINQGFGRSIFSGGINNLLWLCYIIMLALYASAFGSYAPNLLLITHSRQTDFHIYASGIILFSTLINYYSLKIVSDVESFAVIVKLIILLAFIVIGIHGLVGNANLGQLSPQHWASMANLVTGGMVIFVAYEGFELIANAAPDIIRPEKNIPRAYYYSVIFVILLYITIATVTVGSLPFTEIAAARDYVLAEAAKPMVGKIGFTVITIAALISTFSAINASLYGGSRVSYEIAEDDELPHQLTSMLWNHPVGLIITTVLTLLLVNMINLESISTAGSIGFLLIFMLVNLTGFKCSRAAGTSKAITLTGVILSLFALTMLVVQQYNANRLGVMLAASIIAICFFSEYIYKRRVHTNRNQVA